MEWSAHGRSLVNCNCNYGCPCQFNALPTDNRCEAAIGYQVDTGHYGDVSLDGARMAAMYQWPGPIHEGNGTMQLIMDEITTTPKQREALQKIMTGEDTDEMATMWWVFSAMSPNKLETLCKPIAVEIDIEGRIGSVSVPGVFEMAAEPIKNPVTGAAHRARIDMPDGFEYRIAEIGSGTTTTTGEISLKRSQNSHAQFAEMHLSNKGVVEVAA